MRTTWWRRCGAEVALKGLVSGGLKPHNSPTAANSVRVSHQRGEDAAQAWVSSLSRPGQGGPAVTSFQAGSPGSTGTASDAPGGRRSSDTFQRLKVGVRSRAEGRLGVVVSGLGHSCLCGESSALPPGCPRPLSPHRALLGRQIAVGYMAPGE